MSYMNAGSGAVVSHLAEDARAGFIRRTYAHVAMAVAATAAFVAFLIATGAAPIILSFLGGGMINMLIFMGLFIGAGIAADRIAHSENSVTMHYVALLGYAFVEAIVVTPAIYIAAMYKPAAIWDALLATSALVAGLSWIAFSTKKDFSFMGPFLAIGSLIAMAVIFAGVIFGFSIGLVGIGAIVLLAAGCVLYNTSNIIHHYQEHQHVAAALGLYASIALMFRFILQFFLSFGED
ncbi:MAG: Bax inhibitor-1 family protein [Gammaproteobacteria bacterium]|nr:Bax inhibitor-1 family protein [Gammaproteobacteria bacterium]